MEEIVVLLSFFCNPFCFLLLPSLRGLWNMQRLGSLSYYASSYKNVYSTLTKPQELHKCLVQDFGGLKSIVGFQLCVHSCSLFELPPDHTRRITYNSWGEMEEFFIIVCRFISTLVGCLTVKIQGIIKQIIEYLTRCGLWNALCFSLKQICS